MSKIKILPRPRIRDFNDVPEVKGQFCYVFEGCDDDGFSLLIYKNDKEYAVKFGEFDGTEIDVLQKPEHRFLQYISDIMQYSINSYIEVLNLIRIDRIQLFFAPDKNKKLRIVEAMTHLNKYQSPGMIKDVLSKCGVPSPEIHSVEVLTDEIIENLSGGGYLIYPSSPKFMTRNNDSEPVRAKLC